MIERLEAENAALRRERDAAVEDIKYGHTCLICKHRDACSDNQGPICDAYSAWQWRGAREGSEGE